MAWLGSWRNRRKITVSSADVDADLSNFPVLVRLSTTSGKGTSDVSDIFDEVGANKLKIAATLSDGTTELYVEVVHWDPAAEIAELYVKIPSVLSASNTEIYLYYDNNKADNTTYVGVVGSAAGQNVWDSNYVGVWHLAEITGNYLDSTSNGNNSSAVSATSRTATGLITPTSAQFVHDNSDAGITIPDATELRLTNKTIEALAIFNTFYAAEFPDLIHHNDGAGAWYSLELTNDPYEIRHRWGTGFQDYAVDIATGSWAYLVGTTDIATTTGRGYWNADAPAVNSAISGVTAGGAAVTTIGGDGSGIHFLDATMDEVRISNIARPEAWVDATYKTLTDSFITWAAQEVLPAWAHTLNGVLSAGKINTVLTTDVAKVNTI